MLSERKETLKVSVEVPCCGVAAQLTTGPAETLLQFQERLNREVVRLNDSGQAKPSCCLSHQQLAECLLRESFLEKFQVPQVLGQEENKKKTNEALRGLSFKNDLFFYEKQKEKEESTETFLLSPEEETESEDEEGVAKKKSSRRSLKKKLGNQETEKEAGLCIKSEETWQGWLALPTKHLSLVFRRPQRDIHYWERENTILKRYLEFLENLLSSSGVLATESLKDKDEREKEEEEDKKSMERTQKFMEILETENQILKGKISDLEKQLSAAKLSEETSEKLKTENQELKEKLSELETKEKKEFEKEQEKQEKEEKEEKISPTAKRINDLISREIYVGSSLVYSVFSLADEKDKHLLGRKFHYIGFMKGLCAQGVAVCFDKGLIGTKIIPWSLVHNLSLLGSSACAEKLLVEDIPRQELDGDEDHLESYQNTFRRLTKRQCTVGSFVLFPYGPQLYFGVIKKFNNTGVEILFSDGDRRTVIWPLADKMTLLDADLSQDVKEKEKEKLLKENEKVVWDLKRQIKDLKSLLEDLQSQKDASDARYEHLKREWDEKSEREKEEQKEKERLKISEDVFPWALIKPEEPVKVSEDFFSWLSPKEEKEEKEKEQDYEKRLANLLPKSIEKNSLVFYRHFSPVSDTTTYLAGQVTCVGAKGISVLFNELGPKVIPWWQIQSLCLRNKLDDKEEKFVEKMPCFQITESIFWDRVQSSSSLAPVKGSRILFPYYVCEWKFYRYYPGMILEVNEDGIYVDFEILGNKAMISWDQAHKLVVLETPFWEKKQQKTKVQKEELKEDRKSYYLEIENEGLETRISKLESEITKHEIQRTKLEKKCKALKTKCKIQSQNFRADLGLLTKEISSVESRLAKEEKEEKKEKDTKKDEYEEKLTSLVLSPIAENCAVAFKMPRFVDETKGERKSFYHPGIIKEVASSGVTIKFQDRETGTRLIPWNLVSEMVLTGKNELETRIEVRDLVGAIPLQEEKEEEREQAKWKEAMRNLVAQKVVTGSRVLYPFRIHETDRLYPGLIQSIDEKGVRVQFDDEDFISISWHEVVRLKKLVFLGKMEKVEFNPFYPLKSATCPLTIPIPDKPKGQEEADDYLPELEDEDEDNLFDLEEVD